MLLDARVFCVGVNVLHVENHTFQVVAKHASILMRYCTSSNISLAHPRSLMRICGHSTQTTLAPRKNLEPHAFCWQSTNCQWTSTQRYVGASVMRCAYPGMATQCSAKWGWEHIHMHVMRYGHARYVCGRVKAHYARPHVCKRQKPLLQRSRGD